MFAVEQGAHKNNGEKIAKLKGAVHGRQMIWL